MSDHIFVLTTNHKSFIAMNTIVITTDVLNTLRSLPYEDRLNVASALAGEMLLGTAPATDLCPEQHLIYSILRTYVQRASARFQRC